MATYEKVTCETAQFDVVDANEQADTVIEYTTYFTRISTTSNYRPMLAGITYVLADGTPVRRTQGGHFDDENSRRRFFVNAESRAATPPTGPVTRNAQQVRCH